MPIDAGPSDAASGPCVGRFILICRPAVPPSLSITKDATIDTDQEPRCVMEDQGPGAPALCVMTGMDIRVDAAITVIGSHPLVLAAFQDLNITPKGKLILTSTRGMKPGAGANDLACHSPTAGGNGVAAAGGGAGGSFGGTGGAGGTGGTGSVTAGMPGAPIMPIIHVTGGCKGSKGGDDGVTAGGAPGDGGGAVMLIAARKLILDGLVTAGGGGGNVPGALGGGGGGGSGGFVGLDAKTYAIKGQVAANGGGGASSGATALLGAPGEDGTASTTNVANGGVAPLGGAAGGDGSIGALQNGAMGQPGVNGGGGGGGGAGVILLKGTAPTGGTYSPALTIVP